jgi:hypothetical protein
MKERKGPNAARYTAVAVLAVMFLFPVLRVASAQTQNCTPTNQNLGNGSLTGCGAGGGRQHIEVLGLEGDLA